MQRGRAVAVGGIAFSEAASTQHHFCYVISDDSSMESKGNGAKGVSFSETRVRQPCYKLRGRDHMSHLLRDVMPRVLTSFDEVG